MAGFTKLGQRKSVVWHGTTKGSKNRDKVSKALKGCGLARSNQGYSEIFNSYSNEPVMIIDKETSCVNHAHQDTWSGVKTFTHFRRRPQRRP
jgi:hypothetical protein